ncbi:MAG TPA: reverse transcriptase family protein [Burkholderiaceae bacterium]
MFGVKSLSPLSKILWQSNRGIREMAKKPTYVEWVERKPGKKPRPIQDPRGDTEKVHYRIYELLDRVQRPEFLHSATRGRSIVTNAGRHRGAVPSVATDMKGCYDATTVHHVAAFFVADLQIASDLAWKLALICTVHGHLPTGSCLSPLLAYWSHRQAFNEIEALCAAAGVRMTVYVDDLTLSGEHANLQLLWRCKAILAGVGLATHKDKSFPVGGHKMITGVALSSRGLHVPNKRMRAILDKLDLLAASPQADRQKLAQSLSGSIASANAISKRTGALLKQRRGRLAPVASATAPI